MNEFPRQKLCELIAGQGTALCDEPGRCEGYLRDFCPQYRGEVNVLVNALKERVASDLLSASESMPVELLLARLVKRLREHQGMQEKTARWAVESWALALGKISEVDLHSAAAESTAAQSAQVPLPSDRPLVVARVENTPARPVSSITSAASAQGSRSPVKSFRQLYALLALALVVVFGAMWYYFGVVALKPIPPTRSSLLSFYLVVDQSTPFTLELPSPSDQSRSLYLNKKESLIAPYVTYAYAAQDTDKVWMVSVGLALPSSDELQRLTQDSIGRQIAIVVDGAIVSAGVVQSPLSDNFAISGSFTEAEARELARKLKPN